jgi:hypothetical protein
MALRCLNTITDCGGAAESGVFQKLAMKFTFKKKKVFYNLFVGPRAPADSIGSVGDIAVQTPSQELVMAVAERDYARVTPGDKHEDHIIYYKTLESRWRSIDEDRENGRRRCPRLNRPYTTHPKLGSIFVLEEYTFRWRKTTSYFDPKSSTSTNRQIEGSSPSRKRSQAAVTFSDHENEGGKRLRMEIPLSPLPTTVDNTHPLPILAHEGNHWILKEYLLWDAPPISNIHKMHHRGRDILEKLIELPDMIPYDTAMAHVCLLADADHGPFNPEPELRDVIHDLTQAKKANISKINFTLGSRVTHVSTADVLSSLCQAGDHPKHSRPLLGALTIPETKGGLQRCSLTAGPFEESTNHVYECQGGKRPTWLSSINPRGSITDPHIDYCGCSQFIRHISGRKLWLFWPPTAHNLQVFCKKYVSGTLPEFSMIVAIEELENLELLLVDRNKSFVIPSGTIHGVMTFTTSCHTGFKIWGFDNFVAAKDLFNINFEVSQDQSNLDDYQLDHFKEIFEHLKKTEFSKWSELCKKNLGDERSRKVLSWIEECKSKLSQKLNTNR